jgi:hypothetical protein
VRKSVSKFAFQIQPAALHRGVGDDDSETRVGWMASVDGGKRWGAAKQNVGLTSGPTKGPWIGGGGGGVITSAVVAAAAEEGGGEVGLCRLNQVDP